MTDAEKKQDAPDEEQDPAEQPKVFELSGADMADMEEILKDEDAMEAIAAGKNPKKKGADRTAAPGGALPEKVVEALRKKADERDQYLDRLQRVQAEYANFQKRTKKDRVEWAERAVADFLEKMLPVLDGFDGAQRTSETQDAEALREGIQVLRDTLWKILSDAGVTEIEADGLPFDPKVHEAVMQEFTTETDEGRILAVFQRGYQFKDKVVRASRVKIARHGEPPPDPEEVAPEAETQADATVAAELADSAEEAAAPSGEPAAPSAGSGQPPEEETQEIDPGEISPLLEAVDKEEGRRGVKLEGDIDVAHESYDTELLGPPLTGNPLLDEPEDQPHG